LKARSRRHGRRSREIVVRSGSKTAICRSRYKLSNLVHNVDIFGRRSFQNGAACEGQRKCQCLCRRLQDIAKIICRSSIAPGKVLPQPWPPTPCPPVRDTPPTQTHKNLNQAFAEVPLHARSWSPKTTHCPTPNSDDLHHWRTNYVRQYLPDHITPTPLLPGYRTNERAWSLAYSAGPRP